jgi:hypothetical protein
VDGVVRLSKNPCSTQLTYGQNRIRRVMLSFAAFFPSPTQLRYQVIDWARGEINFNIFFYVDHAYFLSWKGQL